MKFSISYGRFTETTLEYPSTRETPEDAQSHPIDDIRVRPLWKTESSASQVPTLSEVKTLQDPRHRKRIRVVERLFSSGFVPNQKATNSVIRSILRHRKKIDSLIAESAPAWPLPKVNKIDLAILRLATWELVIEKKTPQKVVIDEAVELAKQYGAAGSPGFVNGVLGSLIKSL